MPYVPSKKTDGKSEDREFLDVAVEVVAKDIAKNTKRNFDLAPAYKNAFQTLGNDLYELQKGRLVFGTNPIDRLAETIFSVGKKYEYEGAFLGELNYACTRLIQRVPQIKVEMKLWILTSELRYWLYAITTECLLWTAHNFSDAGVGIGGVFIDIKDEYKRRVNTAYEAAQIVKSGDCYDTPYYTRLIEIVDVKGVLIGHQEIMLKRSDLTLHEDVIGSMVMPGAFAIPEKAAEKPVAKEEKQKV